ncbi:hypothetical protein IWQ60_008128 [Tieghemiomyces parasiticus]|uniref:SAM-dependent MTase RsmB/NOP-type domain-containing protein n=1 Tax=Tieghemiomyces parasiticus TaxID=78921 RepID=A0A9W8DMB7_9FUNG|nr:hypothetical protein IWQ60_008128 [Tieghemiomyces parasiticus]
MAAKTSKQAAHSAGKRAPADRNANPASCRQKLYYHARDVLDKLLAHSGSIKGLTVGNQQVPSFQRRPLYALVCETLKYHRALYTIVTRAGLVPTDTSDSLDPKVVGPSPSGPGELGASLTLAMVLTHDLLFKSSAGGLRAISRTKLAKQMDSYRPALKRELQRLIEERGAKSKAELIEVVDGTTTDEIERYVRVNLLRTSVDKVIKAFQTKEFELKDSGARLNDTRQMSRDSHLQDGIRLPPKTDLQAHPLYESGALILQDKASCFPATVLAPEPGSRVIDACAAPGNKTSHLASLMGNVGQIFAIDADPKRLATLVRLTGRAGCRIIEPYCTNFLHVDPYSLPFAHVDYILLDPSCSGSGMAHNRLDHLVDQFVGDADERAGNPQLDQAARLAGLAAFQVQMLTHAMSFPRVKRIVYSTCSIHAIENEAVVARCLAINPGFRLAPRARSLPTWPRRGIPGSVPHIEVELPEGVEEHESGSLPLSLTDDQADCLIRCSAAEDRTHGFFVAHFERVADVEELPAGEDKTLPPSQLTPFTEGAGNRKRRASVKATSGAGIVAADQPEADGKEVAGGKGNKPTAKQATAGIKRKNRGKDTPQQNSKRSVRKPVTS